MPYRDILAILTAGEADEAVVSTLEGMPLFASAHIAAVLAAPMPDLAFYSDAMGAVTIVEAALTAANDAASTHKAAIESRLRQTVLAYETRVEVNPAATAADRLVLQARHVDLTLMAQPGANSIERELFEAVLMRSGRPILLLPPKFRPQKGFKRIMVAWNASREAARALADAAVLLRAAQTILVATMDARGDALGHGEAPGVDISTHLARHGLPVTLHNFDGLGDAPGPALHKAAVEQGADLIVMGGFGHARLQQALFGGVTRDLLTTSQLPLFLSH